MVAAICEVLMWRRPLLASLILGCGTLVWYNCGPLQRSAVSLLCDVMLVLVCTLGLLGILSRQLNLAIPVDPLEWQVSQDAANDMAACVANTAGAAEGVLRVAASGRDCKLFGKVVLVLYMVSAIGRAASGASVAYVALWLIFIFPLFASKLAPEVALQTPTLLQKRWEEAKLKYAWTPENSPRSFTSSPGNY